MEKRNSLDIQVDVLVIIPTVDRTVHMHHAVQKELQAVHMHHAFQKELKTGIISVNMEQAILDHAFQKELKTGVIFLNMEQAIQEEVFSTTITTTTLMDHGTQFLMVVQSALVESGEEAAVFMVCLIFSNFYFSSFFFLHKVETVVLAQEMGDLC